MNAKIALKYLKNTKANLCNILIIVEDFNIRDRDWNPFYLSYSNSLLEIADSFDLKLLYSI